MTNSPPEAPPEAPDGSTGPRVSRDEVRDLARLRRSRSDRKIGGVAGGIARHLDIDPIIPRVLLAVLVFFGGAGILVYAVAWLVVPDEATEEATIRLDDRSRTVALLVVGGLALLALLGDSLGGWGLPWPVGVAGVIVLLVLLARGGEPRLHPFVRHDEHSGPTPPPTTHPATPPVAPPPSRRRGPVLFWYALALIALALGSLGVADLAGAPVSGSAYPALALGITAVLLLVGAFWGRAGGLVLLGLVAAVATAGATVVDQVDAGNIRTAPTTASAVQDRYDLTVGEIDVDLTDVVDPENLDGRTIEVELDVAGRIEVTVPDDVDVTVRTRLDVGERRVFGDPIGDGDDTTTADGGPGAPELTLDVRAAFGEIVIDREGATR